jgi:cytochrome P450
VIDVLIAANLSDKEIEDELLGLMFAGHDTTGHTLSYAIYNICNNQEVLQKVTEALN